MTRRPLVGLFDRGLGGLTVTAAVHQARPDLDLIFHADSGELSIVRSPEQVTQATRRALRRLRDAGADALILACHSADAATRDILPAEFDVPIISVVTACVREAANTTRSGRVGVLGTGLTTRSGVYPKLLGTMAPEREVLPARCSGIVE